MAEVQKTRDRIYGWLHFINSIEPIFAQKSLRNLKENQFKISVDKLTSY